MHINEYQVFQGLNSRAPVTYSSQVPLGQCCPNHWVWDTQSNLSYFGNFFLESVGLYVKVEVSISQSYLTLCNTMDYSLPGSSVHGIFQASILERVAIPFSKGYSWPSVWTQVSGIAGKFFTICASREADFLKWEIGSANKDFKCLNTCEGPNTCFRTACLRGCVSLRWCLCRLEGSHHKRRCLCKSGS